MVAYAGLHIALGLPNFVNFNAQNNHKLNSEASVSKIRDHEGNIPGLISL